MHFPSKWKLAACIAAAACLSIPALAQTQLGQGMFGIYDPATGAFHPVQAPRPATAEPTEKGAIEPNAVTARSGKFVFKINIAIVTNIGGSTTPSCSGSVSHYPQNASFSEQNSISATRTGNTATCQVVLNYLWPQANTSAPVSASISVYGGSRYVSRSLGQIDLPGNGATTTFNLNVRL